jgi:hypothetical protein
MSDLLEQWRDPVFNDRHRHVPAALASRPTKMADVIAGRHIYYERMHVLLAVASVANDTNPATFPSTTHRQTPRSSSARRSAKPSTKAASSPMSPSPPDFHENRSSRSASAPSDARTGSSTSSQRRRTPIGRLVDGKRPTFFDGDQPTFFDAA